MASPVFCTLSGDLGDALGGSPAGAGVLHMTPTSVSGYTSGYVSLPQPVAVPVAADGTFSAQVAACDSGSPRGWVYVCRAEGPGLRSDEFRAMPTGSAMTLAAAIAAADMATESGANAVVLQGPPGPKGDPSTVPGPANVLTVASTTTGAPGTQAQVTVSGTSPSQSLAFTIPRGDTGAPGPAPTLAAGTVSKIAAGGTPTAAVRSTGAGAYAIDLGLVTGNTGPANTLSVGTVTSGATPSATITGTAPSQTLNLVLPKGDKGDVGPTGNAYTITNVTTSTDLNTLTQTGVYNVPSSGVSITNPPPAGAAEAFLIEVWAPDAALSNAFVYQRVTYQARQDMWLRRMLNGGWSAWQQIPNMAGVKAAVSTSPVVTTTTNGVMSATDKTKLDAYPSTPAQIAAATSSANGLMAAADKSKLDSYPATPAQIAVATTSTAGLMSAADKTVVASLARVDSPLALSSGVTHWTNNGWGGLKLWISGKTATLTGCVNVPNNTSGALIATITTAAHRPTVMVGTGDVDVVPDGRIILSTTQAYPRISVAWTIA